MKRLVFTFLSTAAVCAVVSATPALAAPGGADAHAMANQAQIHPTEANQPPVWSPNGVAEGEVYPAEQAYGRGYGAAEPADVLAAVPGDAARAWRTGRGVWGVLTMMTKGRRIGAGWTCVVSGGDSTALPAVTLDPGQPMSVALPAGALADSGGVLMHVNPASLSVHCVAY